jgi:hypothetical protein
MGTAHEAGANQTDAEFTHEKSPLSFYFQKGSLWNKYSLNANIGINIHFVVDADHLVGAGLLAKAVDQLIQL